MVDIEWSFFSFFSVKLFPENRQCWWRLPPDTGPELESFTVNINGVHGERWSIVQLSRHDDAGISLIPRLCGCGRCLAVGGSSDQIMLLRMKNVEY